MTTASTVIEAGDTVRILFGMHAGRLAEVVRWEGRFLVLRVQGGTVTIHASHVEAE